MRVKVKVSGGYPWKHVVITDHPMSCGCGPTLEDLILEALQRDEEIAEGEEVEILAYRILEEQKQVGVTTLRIQRKYRSYGGPEEGGWYYDDPELIREITVPTRRLGTATAKLIGFCERANEGMRSWEDGRLEVRVGRYKRRPRPHYC
jgi:hypothetical protein